ncbi:MAG: hypothetical protein ACKVP9_20245, partial [Burkholderiales bacterium]
PPRAGVAAAFGMIVAPVTYDAVRSRRMLYRDLTAALLGQVHAEMAAECGERLPKTVNPAEVRHEYSVDMRYLGQGYDVNAAFTLSAGADKAIAEIRASFERIYLKLYGRIFADLPLEVMSFRLSASASRHVADVGRGDAPAQGDGKTGTRRAFCPKRREFVEFAVHRRDRIGTGVEFPGPAIVEENESTTVVPSGARVHVDAHGSLIVKLAK